MWAFLKSFLFYIGFGINAIGILVSLVIIISDAIKGSSSKNGTWLMIVLGLCLWLALCWYLKSIGKIGLATNMVMLPAIPIGGYGLFILMFIILKPDMK